MLATFIGLYLILGLPAALLIWIMLIASKGNENKVQNLKRNRSKYKRFHERNSEPDRVHS